MAFLCPECASPKSLEIVARLELPPDSRSDEITLQILECQRCGFAGLGVYEESRRGAFGSETFDHTSYAADKDDLSELKKAIGKCPSPDNRRCQCATHRKYGQRDQSGRWNGLACLRLGNAYETKL